MARLPYRPAVFVIRSTVLLAVGGMSSSFMHSSVMMMGLGSLSTSTTLGESEK